MNIKNIGHSMKYEAECIAMLFFPDEKIVTTEYPADEEEHEELLVQQEQKAPAEDCIETRLQNGLMKVTLSLGCRMSPGMASLSRIRRMKRRSL